MEKRNIANVDEDKIRAMMGGDIPSYYRNQNAETKERKSPAAHDYELTPDDNQSGKPLMQEGKASVKKKSIKDEFAETYLVGGQIKLRSAVYIDSETHRKIKRYLRLIAPEVSISSYVNNILKRHHEVYKDHINDLYNKEVDKFWKGRE